MYKIENSIVYKQYKGNAYEIWEPYGAEYIVVIIDGNKQWNKFDIELEQYISAPEYTAPFPGEPSTAQEAYDNKSKELLSTYYTVIKTTVQYMNKTFGCNEADQEMLTKALRAINKGLFTDPLITWQTYLGEESIVFTPQELSGLEDAISTQDFMLWQKYLTLMGQLKAIDLESPTAISDIQAIIW